MAFLQSVLAWAMSALGTYGYIIVLVATILENLFIVGSFTPGDVLTAGAAFSAAQGHGLNPWILLALATVGTFIGTNISYFIGRRGGRELIERVGPRFGIKIEAIEASEEYFNHHGSQTIVFARFIAVMKNLAPTLAGASRMNLFWFEVYTALGASVYAGLLVGIGWFLGARFEQGLRYLGAFSWLVLLVVVIAFIVQWIARRRYDKRFIASEAAEFEAEHGGRLGESEAKRDDDDA